MQGMYCLHRLGLTIAPQDHAVDVYIFMRRVMEADADDEADAGGRKRLKIPAGISADSPWVVERHLPHPRPSETILQLIRVSPCVHLHGAYFTTACRLMP